jgi:multiple sugar transport system substrate-binding protein
MRRLNRTDNGVQFRGMLPPTAAMLGEQLSLPFADDKTNKATINTEGWAKALNKLKDIYQIPGFVPLPKNHKASKMFLEDRTVGMFINFSNNSFSQFERLNQTGTPMNFDISTYPSFQENPNVGMQLYYQVLMVSQTSQHKELMLKIIDLLTSKENQLRVAKQAFLSVLSDASINQQYGSDMASLKGKNIAALLKTKPAEAKPSLLEDIVQPIITKAGEDVGTGKKDVNTVLREVQDAADKAIQASASK